MTPANKRDLVSLRNQAEHLSKSAELALERGEWKEAQDISVLAVKARNEYNKMFLVFATRTRTGVNEVHIS